MTKPTKGQIRQLSNLSQLTELALESHLATLRKAAEARDATRAALAALAAPRPIPQGEVALAAKAQADMLYDRWVDHRRTEMNLLLARQTATWLDLRADAAIAFGRNDVLNRLAVDMRAKLAKQARKA